MLIKATTDNQETGTCACRAASRGNGGGEFAAARARLTSDIFIGNESAPIQLAQCRFPRLAISIAKI